jgi:hypothetical protein
MPDLFESKPTDYQGFCYQIFGKPGSYRFVLRLPSGLKLLTSEPFSSVVLANTEARKRINLAVAVLGVPPCQ